MKSDSQKAKSAAWLSLTVNLFMAIIKGLAGIFGNSAALMADATESISDLFSSLLVIAGLKYAQRPADDNHPYGHGKIEALVTFGITSLLIGSAVIIGLRSIESLQEENPVPEGFTLYVLLFVIAVKEGFYRYQKRQGEKTGSSSLIADAWHHRSDALSSVVALVGVGISLWGGEAWAMADEIAAMLTSVLIIYNSYLILRPALGEVMDEHLYPELELAIRKSALEVDQVLETEKCFIRKYGSGYLVDLHIEVNGELTVREGHAIAHKLKDHLTQEYPQIQDVLIHVEPSSSD